METAPTIQERIDDARQHERERRGAWDQLITLVTNMEEGDRVKAIKALQDVERHHIAASMGMALVVGLAESTGGDAD